MPRKKFQKSKRTALRIGDCHTNPRNWVATSRKFRGTNTSTLKSKTMTTVTSFSF